MTDPQTKGNAHRARSPFCCRGEMDLRLTGFSGMLIAEKGGVGMKCQHCGVNFDDEERACPICGARAGSRGRMSASRGTGSTQRRYTKTSGTQRSCTTAASGKTGSGKPKTTVAGKRGSKMRAGIVVALLVVLVEFLPAGMRAVSRVWEDITDRAGHAVREPAVPAQEETPSQSSRSLYDLLGPETAIDLPDGGMIALSLGEGEGGAYRLVLNSAAGQYIENGETWCSYDGVSTIDEAFSEEEYDWYAVALTCLEVESGLPGGEPLWAAVREPGEDIWLMVYVSRVSGGVILEDLDEIGLFDGERFAVVYRTENA